MRKAELVASLGIDDVQERRTAHPAFQIGAEHLHGPAFPALVNARAVRRQDDVVQVPKRAVARQWLGLEIVQGRAGDPPGAKRLDQRGAVDHAAARDGARLYVWVG